MIFERVKKMKYHKMKNIPLEVCTAEQKIAYNLAWYYGKNFIKKYKSAPCAFQKDEVLQETVQFLMHLYNTDNETKGKYDIDAIFCALNAGIKKFFDSNGPILSGYEEIGEMFKRNY